MSDRNTLRDGIRIAWSRSGSRGRQPLVLLNSIGTDRSLWAATVDRLTAAGLDLLRIDTRGHGQSDAPDRDYTLSELAGDIVAVMDDACIGRADVAGVSLGGMIAMQLALDVPARTDRLALICTSAVMDPVAWATRVDMVRVLGMAAVVPLAMARFLSPDFVAEQPDLAAAIEGGLTRMAAAGYAGCAAAIRDMDIASRLPAIAAKTLVVTGDRDVSTPFEGHGDRLLRGIPDAVGVRLDCAHLAPVEVPDRLADALIGFLTNAA